MLYRRGSQGQFLYDAIFQASQLVCHAGGQCKAFVLDKLFDHSYHMFVSQEFEQLAGEATVPDGVICRFQIYKHNADLIVCFKTVLNALDQQNCLINGWSPALKSNLLIKEQWIDNGYYTGMNKPFEDLIRDTKQRDQMIALFFSWFWWLWNRDYTSSSPDFGYSEMVQAGRLKVL